MQIIYFSFQPIFSFLSGGMYTSVCAQASDLMFSFATPWHTFEKLITQRLTSFSLGKVANSSFNSGDLINLFVKND
jgi:hypothetical protein